MEHRKVIEISETNKLYLVLDIIFDFNGFFDFTALEGSHHIVLV